jgi:hypothetical protein
MLTDAWVKSLLEQWLTQEPTWERMLIDNFDTRLTPIKLPTLLVGVSSAASSLS